ncbi:MAG: hypothetical protein CMI53_00945 [Parcubacteria group bacterium]|nr:hypothetical protein [Parcubacteria group bacterium]|tara:strand:- start:6345 stop:6611 length:267 start_codon:yes stop_codon:yes gene_type:complete
MMMATLIAEGKTAVLKKNLPYLSKGALRLEEDKFDELAKAIGSGNGDVVEDIRSIVDERLSNEETMARKQAQTESDVIAEIADRQTLP